MAVPNASEHKAIELKVRKLIEKNLDQRGITSIGLLGLCKEKVAALKQEHDYLIMNWVGRSLTILIKEGNARIGYDDVVVLKFFATK